MSTDLRHGAARHALAAATTAPRSVVGDCEYVVLRLLAARHAVDPPWTPLDALQHVVDVAREVTDATYAALAVTGADDYVEGFVVSGLDDAPLKSLKVAPQGHGPLGTMRQDGLAVRTDDVSAHAKAFGFPPKHPEMKGLLGVPIFAGAEVRGALYVTDRRDHAPFGAADELLLDALARHAGLIIAASWY